MELDVKERNEVHRGALLDIEERGSDSPFVERIWHSRSEGGGQFRSVATSYWEVVFMQRDGKLEVTMHGPETKATPAYIPPDGEWTGIIFKLGTVMPYVPPYCLVDQFIELPGASGQRFWLQGATLEVPTFENADAFVERLVRDRLLIREPLVDDLRLDQLKGVSLRTAQRHFARATGLSQKTLRHIQRARYATRLLQQGTPILDAAYEVGYYDQAHMTNALRHLIGLTPAQIQDTNNEQLSFISTTQMPY